jgi:hypothetical protein
MDYEMRRQSDISHPISTEDHATRASFAFRTLSDDSRSLDLINRYDSRYQREYLRAHRRFLEVRDRRTPPTPAAPEVEPPPVQESEVSKGTREVAENKPAPFCAAKPVDPPDSGKSRQPIGVLDSIRT